MKNNNENVVVATDVVNIDRINPTVIQVRPIENPITEEMKVVYSLGNTIKLLCFFDIFISFVYSLYNLFFFIPLIFALCGLYGVKNYNYRLILFYLAYEIIIFSTRLITFFYALSCCIRNIYFIQIIFLILSTIIGIWIIEILYKYIKNLKKLTNNEIIRLREINHIHNTTPIYY